MPNQLYFDWLLHPLPFMTKASLTELQKKRKTRFPISRVKKLIQQNEDIGKTSVTVPVVLSKAIELFFGEIIEKMTAKAKDRKSNKIQISDFKSVIEEEQQKYSFLNDLLQKEEEVD